MSIIKDGIKYKRSNKHLFVHLKSFPKDLLAIGKDIAKKKIFFNGKKLKL